MVSCHLQMVTVYFFPSNLDDFFFSCLISMVRTSNTVLNIIIFIFDCATLSFFSSCVPVGLPSAQVCRLLLCDFCCRARALDGTGLIVVVPRLCCPAACEIFVDQRGNPCLLNWQVDPLRTEPTGKPLC